MYIILIVLMTFNTSYTY